MSNLTTEPTLQPVYADVTNVLITDATLLTVSEAKKIKKDDRAHHQWWWLRSPGTRNCDVAYVRRDGTISPDGRFAEDAVTTCVRPALIIKTTFFEIGDTFEINGYHFKMITKNRAWLYSEDLGNFIFNKGTNIYEDSEIKQFVDNWFEKEIKPYISRITPYKYLKHNKPDSSQLSKIRASKYLEHNLFRVKFEETVNDISYFIAAPLEWTEDYDALSDVFATISLEGDIVRISPTRRTKDEYIDYDWRDFPLSENEIRFLKFLANGGK